MPSGSTNSRRKMKKERPEKYQQYLDSQKKRSAEYRRKMKESLANPTEKDKEKRARHLEKQRARMQRYLERKKRQKAAALGATFDADSANRGSYENEPVSSTSGNVDDILEDDNIAHQGTDTGHQSMEIQSSDFIIPSRDREMVFTDDKDGQYETIHVERQQNQNGQPDNGILNDDNIPNQCLRTPQDRNSQIDMRLQDQDNGDLDHNFADADMGVREGRYTPHQSEEISQSDGRPVDHQIRRQSPRSDIDSWTQSIPLYHDPQTLRKEGHDESGDLTNLNNLQIHTPDINGSSDPRRDCHIPINSLNLGNPEIASNGTSRQYINMDTGSQIRMPSTITPTGNCLSSSTPIRIPLPPPTRTWIPPPTSAGHPLPTPTQTKNIMLTPTEISFLPPTQIGIPSSTPTGLHPPTHNEIPLHPPTPTGLPSPTHIGIPLRLFTPTSLPLSPPAQTEITLPPPTQTRTPLPIANELPLPPPTRSPVFPSTQTGTSSLPPPTQMGYPLLPPRQTGSPLPSEILLPLTGMHLPPLNLSTRRNPSPLPYGTEMQIYSASSRHIASPQPIQITGLRDVPYLTSTAQSRNPFTTMPQYGEQITMVNRDLRNDGPISSTVSGDTPFSSADVNFTGSVSEHDRILDSIAGPSSLPAPTPYTRYRSQQISMPTAATGRTSDYNACAEHPGEKVRVCCIDCDRKLLCVECLPRHRRHALTRYRMLDHGEIIQQIDIRLDGYPDMMMMIGSVFYFNTEDSITTYNMNTDTTEQIDTDGGLIRDMCLSPDNTSIWYCTRGCEVYEYYVENRKFQLRFTCDSVATWSICVTRSGDVVLGVQRCSDDSDGDDSDSDVSDRGCDVKYKWYLEMYTQQDSYTTCTTSVCIKGKRGLKYGVEPYHIMACPVTGDLLVTDSNTVLLTDDKCNTKYWFRGKTVTNKHGDRKRTGYNRRLCFGAACFDKEGNILILNWDDYYSVIVIDHDTGMYIRTVHQEPDIHRMCIQDNGLLWCCVDDDEHDDDDDFKYKLKSVKYMEKLL